MDSSPQARGKDIEALEVAPIPKSSTSKTRQPRTTDSRFTTLEGVEADEDWDKRLEKLKKLIQDILGPSKAPGGVSAHEAQPKDQVHSKPKTSGCKLPHGSKDAGGQAQMQKKGKGPTRGDNLCTKFPPKQLRLWGTDRPIKNL